MLPFAPHPRLVDAQRFAEEMEAVRRRSLELGIPSIDPQDGLILYTAALLSSSLAEDAVLVDAGAGIGYSSLWIARGVRDAGCSGCRLYAVEWDPELARLARETLGQHPWAQGIVEVVEGDAVELIARMRSVALAFVDVEKSLYPETVKLLSTRLVPGGVALWHNAFYPAPPRRFYELLDSSPLRWGIAPTPAGMVVAVKPPGLDTRRGS